MAKHFSGANEQLWYKDAIIYELHIKAFRDSNRDGIGDFRGLMEKLDYLQELGITAIWLLPFYPSPLKDDGYDIADYYSINPRYGTLEQFRELLDEAHKRNLKVITELVINHTSDQHPWFQRARTAPPGSPERNYYVWSDDPNRYKDVRIIFQDFEASNWTWDPVAQQYYWHRFFHHQPDLNYDTPEVQEEIFRIIDYWCAMGVDGFRLDAVPYLYEREGTNGENLPETHAFLKRLRKYIDERYPGIAFLAEANMWPEDSASYFGNGDECHMNYHFPVMPRMFMSVQLEDRYPITDIFDQTPVIPDNCQWAIFLRNHDELTLEMVTDEERDFMYKVYAKDPKARINLGIRHRLAPLMDNNRNRIELMNSLLFSLPGTPVIYYGDEIGMGDNYYLGDRDGVRTPMQWSPDRNSGFSEANPQQLYLPVILDPEYHYEAVNVEMQRRNTSSLFWFMKRMINLRKKHPAFSRGDMQFIQVDNPKILAFTRSYEGETILVIANLSKYAQPAEIDLRAYKGFIPVELFSKNSFPMIREDQLYFFTLSPHSFQWYVLQNIRSKKDEGASLPALEISGWESILKGDALGQLESAILIRYMNQRRWFKGRGRKIYALQVQHSFPFSAGPDTGNIILVEVSYESGLPETYQIALAPVNEEEAKRLVTFCPEAIITPLVIGGKPSALVDAFYLPFFHQRMITALAGKEELEYEKDRVLFHSEATVPEYLEQHPGMLAKMHTSDENNTSITYGNRFFLKMYRKIDWTIHPDVELNQYLSGRAGFAHTPKFLGTIEWETEKGKVVLGMLQEMVENHGDGQSYMQERLNNFIERILARNGSRLQLTERRGSLMEPAAFEELPDELRDLLGARAAEQSRIIGIRTAQMHQALSGNKEDRDFLPEEYSLHYQRSLFSGMQALVRESFQSLERKMPELSASLKNEAVLVVKHKEELLNRLKRIYTKKLDIWKIRIHGTYNLKKILMTGKDLVIQDFGGNPQRSYSERRLKRSPVRDLAEMITSFYYCAYESFLNSPHLRQEEQRSLIPFAELWSFYMSGFFLRAYFEAVEGTALIPMDKQDRELILTTFLLEKALWHLNHELNNRPEYAIVPIQMIKQFLGIREEQEQTG